MKRAALLMTFLVASVTLAGCADGGGTGTQDAEDNNIDPSTFRLQSGKGAIAGLLVDDRFRPLQLTDDASSEFQAEGFVLLQELGLETLTNANGEFSFVDLEPGRYTLRVTVSGHEVTPQTVVVEVGVFAETTIIARRISSVGGSIVTEEYTGFAACSGAVIATSFITNCIDTSGESDRRGTSVNFTGLDATYLIVEVRVDEPGSWLIEVSGDGRSPQYGTVRFTDDVYGKRIYEFNGTYGDQNPVPWQNDQNIATLMFFQGDIVPPGSSPTCGEVGVGCSGVGAAIGKRVRMMFSAFVGEPEIDLETYEVLAADAT